jgi:hypothetical protein
MGVQTRSRGPVQDVHKHAARSQSRRQKQATGYADEAEEMSVETESTKTSVLSHVLRSTVRGSFLLWMRCTSVQCALAGSENVPDRSPAKRKAGGENEDTTKQMRRQAKSPRGKPQAQALPQRATSAGKELGTRRGVVDEPAAVPASPGGTSPGRRPAVPATAQPQPVGGVHGPSLPARSPVASPQALRQSPAQQPLRITGMQQLLATLTTSARLVTSTFYINEKFM